MPLIAMIMLTVTLLFFLLRLRSMDQVVVGSSSTPGDAIVDSLLAAPVAADGEVEDEILFPVVGPGVPTGPLVAVGEVLPGVDEEVDLLGVPLDGVDVERLRGVGDGDPIALVGLLTWLYLACGCWRGSPGVEADELHDVDLAAAGPADLADIGAEGPDRRPGPAAGGELGAHLDPAVGPGGLASGRQARRGVLRGLTRRPLSLRPPDFAAGSGPGIGYRSFLASMISMPPSTRAFSRRSRV